MKKLVNANYSMTQVEITATEWRKGNLHRIYFKSRDGGQACWDVVGKDWISVKREFGPVFKENIRRTFDL